MWFFKLVTLSVKIIFFLWKMVWGPIIFCCHAILIAYHISPSSFLHPLPHLSTSFTSHPPSFPPPLATLSHPLPHLTSTFPSYILSLYLISSSLPFTSPSSLLHLPFLHPLTLSLISPPSLLTPSYPLPHTSSTFPSYTLSPSPSSLLHLPFLHPLTLSLISPPPSLLTPSHPLPHISSTFPSYTLSPSLSLISPPPSLLTPSHSHYFLFYFPTPSHTLPNLSSTFPPCIHLAFVLSYSYAFALEESSQRRTAEALARKALAMNPTIAWSYHALCESRLLRPKGSVECISG